jgi:uncharacterized protein YhaN
MTPPTPKDEYVQTYVVDGFPLMVGYADFLALKAERDRANMEAEAEQRACERACAERDAAVQRSEYWKAEHIAANAVIDELRTRLAEAEERYTAAEQARDIATQREEHFHTENAKLKNRLAAAEQHTRNMTNALGFFASCIKSGEAWSGECEKMLRAAYAALTHTRQTAGGKDA